MSDAPQGEGWWLASDGKWYPPQSAQTQAQGATKSWWKRKRLIVPLVLVALVVIAIGSSGGAEKSTSDTNAASKNTSTEKAAESKTTEAPLFPGRPDAQKKDQERNVGQAVEFSGYTTTVTAAAFQPTVSEFEQKGYVVADVTVKNRDAKAQLYNTFHWKLQTPGGQVIDPYFGGDQLGSGDLVTNGEVAGKVIFEVGNTKGDFYLIYKPDAFDASRGIWKVTV